MRKGGKLESWKVEKLGDVIQLEYGKPLDASKRSEDGKYPVYGANGEIARSNEYYYDKPTMIVGRKGSAGEINLTEKKFWALDVTYFVTFDDKKYDLQFLYYLLSKLELTKLAKGVKPGINRNDVYSIDVASPPLPEQQRIVSVLDEAFASIAQAKSNAERNLVNARELFGSYLESLFADSRGGWEEKKLGDVCERITDGTHVTPKYVPEGVPFLSVKNLTKGFIDFSDTRFITPEEHAILTKRVRPEREDVLYTKVGTTGVAKVVDVDVEFSIFVSIALLKLKHEVIFNKYLEFFLNSPFARKQAQQRTRGTANKNLVITDIKEIEIHFPKSLAEQRAIVGRLEALSAETGRLEEIYQSKVEGLEELKKSVLSRAFGGEL